MTQFEIETETEMVRTARNVTRFQVELPPERVQLVDEMVRRGGFGSRKELVNNALSLLQWVMKEAERGRAIASVDEAADRYTELHMPFLSQVPLQK